MFIGCRNHSLLPMSLSYQHPFSEQVDPPPPSGQHLDIVTSFCTILDEGVLISASKDKSLRGWSTLQSNPDQSAALVSLDSFTTKAHSNHINVVRASRDQANVFSGCKDGVVNIWAVNTS